MSVARDSVGISWSDDESEVVECVDPGISHDQRSEVPLLRVLILLRFFPALVPETDPLRLVGVFSVISLVGLPDVARGLLFSLSVDVRISCGGASLTSFGVIAPVPPVPQCPLALPFRSCRPLGSATTTTSVVIPARPRPVLSICPLPPVRPARVSDVCLPPALLAWR